MMLRWLLIYFLLMLLADDENFEWFNMKSPVPGVYFVDAVYVSPVLPAGEFFYFFARLLLLSAFSCCFCEFYLSCSGLIIQQGLFSYFLLYLQIGTRSLSFTYCLSVFIPRMNSYRIVIPRAERTSCLPSK